MSPSAGTGSSDRRCTVSVGMPRRPRGRPGRFVALVAVGAEEVRVDPDDLEPVGGAGRRAETGWATGGTRPYPRSDVLEGGVVGDHVQVARRDAMDRLVDVLHDGGRRRAASRLAARSMRRSPVTHTGRPWRMRFALRATTCRARWAFTDRTTGRAWARTSNASSQGGARQQQPDRRASCSMACSGRRPARPATAAAAPARAGPELRGEPRARRGRSSGRAARQRQSAQPERPAVRGGDHVAFSAHSGRGRAKWLWRQRQSLRRRCPPGGGGPPHRGTPGVLAPVLARRPRTSRSWRRTRPR